MNKKGRKQKKYGEHFKNTNDFIQKLNDYIYYYNNDRISLKLKGMSPVQYRTHSQRECKIKCVSRKKRLMHFSFLRISVV